MSSETAISRAALDVSAGSEGSLLHLHDAAAPTTAALSQGAIAREDAGALDRLRGLLGGLLDRGTAKRYEHYAVSHAGYRWKPKLALVLPSGSPWDALATARLTVALEVLASVIDHYNISVVSDSPDAARTVPRVVPFSHEAISASTGRW